MRFSAGKRCTISAGKVGVSQLTENFVRSAVCRNARSWSCGNAMADGRPKPSMYGVSHVPEFVGIAHDIDGNDAAIRDIEGGGLENVAALNGDEPR
jgi:hypothetical protein